MFLALYTSIPNLKHTYIRQNGHPNNIKDNGNSQVDQHKPHVCFVKIVQEKDSEHRKKG